MTSTAAADALAFGHQLAAAAQEWMRPGEIYWAYGYSASGHLEQDSTIAGPAAAYARITAAAAGWREADSVRIWVFVRQGGRVVIAHQAAGTAGRVRREIARWGGARPAPRREFAATAARLRAAARQLAARPVAMLALLAIGLGMAAGLTVSQLAHPVTVSIAIGTPPAAVSTDTGIDVQHAPARPCVMLCDTTPAPSGATGPAHAAADAGTPPPAAAVPCAVLCTHPPAPHGPAAVVATVLHTLS